MRQTSDLLGTLLIKSIRGYIFKSPQILNLEPALFRLSPRKGSSRWITSMPTN
jgi:hypothetical protein